MKHARSLALMAFVMQLHSAGLCAETIRGKVGDQSGIPMEGVMVSAFDQIRRIYQSFLPVAATNTDVTSHMTKTTIPRSAICM